MPIFRAFSSVFLLLLLVFFCKKRYNNTTRVYEFVQIREDMPMKKILGSKLWTAIVLILASIGLFIAVRYFAESFLPYYGYQDMTIMIDGVYQIDGGLWLPIDRNKPITKDFHRIIFKGTIPEEFLEDDNYIYIVSKNVWYNLKLDDKTYGKGEFALGYDLSPGSMQATDDTEDMPKLQTPGYNFLGFNSYTLKLSQGETRDVRHVTFEVTRPYSFATEPFSNCFHVIVCAPTGVYRKLILEILPSLVPILLMCFLGIILFPLAGFIMGKLNTKYFTVGILCLAFALFMITKNLAPYAGIWFMDTITAMALDKLAAYALVLAVFAYFKSHLNKPVTRAIANIAITVFFLTIVTTAVLHWAQVMDLVESGIFVNVAGMICGIMTVVLLISEVRSDRSTVRFLLSWTPLLIGSVLQAAEWIFNFSVINFFVWGLATTLIFQLASVIIDIRNQYREKIRQEQLRQELYEARVSLMVSQIRPHFMYNTLSSIAVLCKLDPDTAYNATVNFSDYIRGNMDSLKQTAPVLFSKELDHLKKYLYIEKLRFQDKLNIEYDIQETDFYLPLLSVQPLVENAVKHGVGMKEEGGTVTITTRDAGDAYEIIIRDDGVGFDTQAPKADDGRSHVGMENTKKRLQDMCHGEVIIESTPGQGTTARIILPKDAQPDAIDAQFNNGGYANENSMY